MRFQVPQFIEIEDKIFGPLTFKQFIYIAGSIGLAIIFFTFLPTFIAILISLPVVGFGAMLAFYKVNGKPFINTVESAVKYFLGSKLYLWKKVDRAPVAKTPEARAAEQVYVPKLSQSKLKDLAWSLDVTANQNPVTKDEGEEDK
jgi:hypothetical protein